MNNIKRISVIDRIKLNEELYFQSLLMEGYNCNMLNDSDIERIQFECLELLAYKVKRYNSGDSSSVRVEVAENIMKSNIYAIEIQLKSFQNPDDAVNALKDTKISELYKCGNKKIGTKFNAAKHIMLLVDQNKIDTYNYAYNSTITHGIKKLFFKTYDPDYQAHETPACIDYQLCNPAENLTGVEYIQKYLESIYYENMFCNHFSSDNIHHLLCGYDENYRDLLINIFEHVLTTALGCELCGVDVVSLNISENQIHYLQSILSQKSHDEISEIIFKTAIDLQDKLSLDNISLQKYIENSLPKIALNISLAIRQRTLNKVFIPSKHPELNPKIQFSFGTKMDNEVYRSIIDEISQCRFLSDKLAIIKNKIHSLSDLEDLLLDGELLENETMAILNVLDKIEIAALAKRHPYKSTIDAIDISESENLLSMCLYNYISLQTTDCQEHISKVIKNMDDDVVY